MKIVKSLFHFIKSLILSVFLIGLIIFMVHNRDAVTLHMAPLPFNIETRMFVVLIVLFLLGMLFSFLALSHNIIGGSIANIKNRRKIKKLEATVVKE